MLPMTKLLFANKYLLDSGRNLISFSHWIALQNVKCRVDSILYPPALCYLVSFSGFKELAECDVDTVSTLYFHLSVIERQYITTSKFSYFLKVLRTQTSVFLASDLMVTSTFVLKPHLVQIFWSLCLPSPVSVASSTVQAAEKYYKIPDT